MKRFFKRGGDRQPPVVLGDNPYMLLMGLYALSHDDDFAPREEMMRPCDPCHSLGHLALMQYGRPRRRKPPAIPTEEEWDAADEQDAADRERESQEGGIGR